MIRGENCDWGSIMAGVPQGSVLGPLLFISYINDLADVVDCNIKMFTDNTSLYLTIDDAQVSADLLKGREAACNKYWPSYGFQ